MGRVGIYGRNVMLKDGVFMCSNLGYSDCIEHNVCDYVSAGIVKRLWEEVRTGKGVSISKSSEDYSKIRRVYEKDLKIASQYKYTVFGNFMLPASVYTYSHRIVINNERNRAFGIKCLLDDGEYALLSVGVNGFNTDKWKLLVGNKKSVGEECLLPIDDYQNLACYSNIDTNKINMACVWSASESCFYLLMDNVDCISQLRADIRRGSVALYSKCDQRGLCIGVLDKMGF